MYAHLFIKLCNYTNNIRLKYFHYMYMYINAYLGGRL